MRVLFLSYSYEKGLRADAGGFRKLWELAWALKKLGHEVLVFYPDLPGYFPLRDVPFRSYTVLDFPLVRPLMAYFAQIAQATAVGLRERPDILYFRSGFNVLPLILKRMLGAKLVLEVNADTLGFLESEGIGDVSRWFFRLTEGMNVRRCDRIVALTPGLKRILIGRYGIPAAKVWVIPSGTDPVHFTPEEPATARRRIGLPPDRPVVGFVGLFYRHQGVPTLLEALASLRGTVPGLSGLIVGDGVMRPDWEALANRLGLQESVRFVGQVPYDEVPAYLSAMDIIVAPFTADRGETSPFKVLDAMACQRPVVASDLPSVRALAEESGAIALVPPDDPKSLAKELERLLADPERRATMGRQGRVFVCTHHDWNHIGELVSRCAMESARR
jgi:glycosyltransferase involved in cell wall biosynthesis